MPSKYIIKTIAYVNAEKVFKQVNMAYYIERLQQYFLAFNKVHSHDKFRYHA